MTTLDVEISQEGGLVDTLMLVSLQDNHDLTYTCREALVCTLCMVPLSLTHTHSHTHTRIHQRHCHEMNVI